MLWECQAAIFDPCQYPTAIAEVLACRRICRIRMLHAVAASHRECCQGIGAPEMDSEATTRAPMAAWMGTLNCWRGMSSFSRTVSPLPTRYASSRCTIVASGSTCSPLICARRHA